MPELKIILHVDDDDDILELTKMALELVGGLEVYQCRSATETFAMIDRVSPDLLLLDVMMPGVDGFSLLAKIREDERFQEIPVVFMTARTIGLNDPVRPGNGVVGTISKPFDPLELASQLQQHWIDHISDPDHAIIERK